MLVIVKVTFDRTSQQIRDFVNRLWHALNDLEKAQFYFEKVCSHLLAEFNFSFVMRAICFTLNLTLPGGIFDLKQFVFCQTG